MKRISLILILINFFSVSYSQTIRGTILDKTNNNSITFASVYINGSYIGTNSDQNGFFELDLPKLNSLPLTISALGYSLINADSERKEETINKDKLPPL
jgi:predicted permease